MSVVSGKIELSKEKENPMEELLNTITAIVSTDCQCDTYNEDTDTYEPATDCSGDCYEWQKEDVFYVLGEWQKLNDIDEDDLIRITGTGIGWQSRSGYKDTDILELDGALAIDGEFRITWTLDLDTKQLRARRTSHDEPMGANFEIDFIKMTVCDNCDSPISVDVHAEELGMCVDCSNEYFTHNDEEPIDL
jgi:hypothetical protein